MRRAFAYLTAIATAASVGTVAGAVTPTGTPARITFGNGPVTIRGVIYAGTQPLVVANTATRPRRLSITGPHVSVKTGLLAPASVHRLTVSFRVGSYRLRDTTTATSVTGRTITVKRRPSDLGQAGAAGGASSFGASAPNTARSPTVIVICDDPAYPEICYIQGFPPTA
ncbi:MAG: hypothetical protein WCH31_00935 [Actinomycetes bacterium]